MNSIIRIYNLFPQRLIFSVYKKSYRNYFLVAFLWCVLTSIPYIFTKVKIAAVVTLKSGVLFY
ncbi:hypothetical protein OA93_00480 [Flavobacterium sp. KMS]|nr:hypothetical protein OA93_00480 [Flavobacterium sp. KMS]